MGNVPQMQYTLSNVLMALEQPTNIDRCWLLAEAHRRAAWHVQACHLGEVYASDRGNGAWRVYVFNQGFVPWFETKAENQARIRYHVLGSQEERQRCVKRQLDDLRALVGFVKHDERAPLKLREAVIVSEHDLRSLIG